MTRICVVLFVLSFIFGAANALPPSTDLDAPSNATHDVALVDNDTYIDANRILMFVTNHGNFGRDLSGVFGNDYGTYFPFTSIADIMSGANIKSPLYAGGLWLGGTVDGDIRVAVAEYSDEYVPGPMSGGTYEPDNPDFRVYKLSADSLAGNPNEDYLTWPVDQGAPLDGSGNPLMRGDQHLWAVYNDADPYEHWVDAGSTDPLGIEVRQSVWASNESDQQSTLHIQYDLFNEGGATIDSFFIAIWLDPDLGGAGDDYVGCDSANQIIYCYNADNDDQHYAGAPPALGVEFERGPMVPSPGDTAWYNGAPVIDHRNLTLYSFNMYINGTDPDNHFQTYNYMRGLSRDGSPQVDPTTGEVTRFVLRGDPVTGTGWVDSSPSDRRMMASYGPFTFSAGDSQQVLFTMAVGQGPDRIASLIEVRNILEGGSGGDEPEVVAADECSIAIENYRELQDVWFSPSSERWLTGRYGLPMYAAENVQMAFQSTYGSIVQPDTDPGLFTSVELRFSTTSTQKAYRYCLDFDVIPELFYDYCGYVDVPFTVWDTENNRQLNVLLYEYSAYPAYYDGAWSPAAYPSLEGRDYLFIAASDYAGEDPTNTPHDYTSMNLADDDFDLLYVARLLIEAGHSIAELADGQTLTLQAQTLNPDGEPDTVFFREVVPGDATWQAVTLLGLTQGLSTVLLEVAGDDAFSPQVQSQTFTYALDMVVPVAFQPDDAGLHTAVLTVIDSVSGAVLDEVVLVGTAANPPLSASAAVEPSPLPPLPRLPITISVGALEGGYTVHDIDQSTLEVNGEAFDGDIEIVAPKPDPASAVLLLSARALEVLDDYPSQDGEVTRTIEVSFRASDFQEFVATGTFQLIGLLIGDINGDRLVDLSDLIHLVNHLFLGGPAPVAVSSANVNCDAGNTVDLSDLIRLAESLFLGGGELTPCP